MKDIFLFLVALLFVVKTQAQIFEGTVVDAKSKAVLPYVNLGVVGKSIGTVSDLDGHFKLLMGNDADSLKISMIGYKPQTFLVADVKKDPAKVKVILLEPPFTALNEVKVNNRKRKQSVVGNTTEADLPSTGFTKNTLGHEIGIIIKTKRSPTLVKRFNASITSIVSDSVKLRLNFYTVENGLPAEIINTQNIFVTVKKGEQNISVDLMQYNIMVEDHFFVNLEWIQRTDGHGLMFSAGEFDSLIWRETSQAKWEKTGSFGVGFNVLAEY